MARDPPSRLRKKSEEDGALLEEAGAVLIPIHHPADDRINYESFIGTARAGYRTIDLASDEEVGNFNSSPLDRTIAERHPKEPLKTLLSFVIMLLCMISTTLALAVVHDRVPSTPPLPDIVFDLAPQWDLGLSVAEYILIVSVWMAIFVVVFHKHRWIIFRRIFFITGLLYLGRAVTMVVTALPVANSNYYCSPKMTNVTALVILERMWMLIGGFGLSVNGRHVFCGDYIYSGHTCMLVMAALIVCEYAPRKMYPLYVLMALMAGIGIACVSVSRGHYTVDIIIAYYVTTRIFWIYHTVASNTDLKKYQQTNHLSRVFWFPVARYLEINVAEGNLPKQFDWPLPFPKSWQHHRFDFAR